jgi:hypothetical protein
MTVPAGDNSTGSAAMNPAAVPKSHRTNMCEGIALTAIFQGFPILTGAALLQKLFGGPMVSHHGDAAIFVVLSSLCYAVTIGYFAPKFPEFFKSIYQPLFFDATLSFNEKATRWRQQPATSQQLVAMVLMLSVLAVVVMSVR